MSITVCSSPLDRVVEAEQVDWSKLVAELSGAEYYLGIVMAETKPFRVTFEVGLSDSEVAEVELRHSFHFPPDLRAFLQMALPTGDGFPDWRGNDWPAPRSWMEDVKQGILFDVEHNSFWLEEWGIRLESVRTQWRSLPSSSMPLHL